MKAKYPKGTRVKVTIGHPIWTGDRGLIDIRPDLTEDIATVEYTYGERFDSDKDIDWKNYSLKFDKHGSIASFHESVIVPLKAN